MHEYHPPLGSAEHQQRHDISPIGAAPDEPPPLRAVATGPQITPESDATAIPDLVSPYEEPAEGHEAQTKEYTSGDKQRILGMVAAETARRRKTPNITEEAALATVQFCHELRNEGAIAAQVIIDTMNDPAAQVKFTRAWGMECLDICATPENEDALVALMADHRQRRVTVTPLVRTLQRVATPASIPSLLDYVAKGTDTTDVSNRMYNIIAIASAGVQLAPDGSADQQRWQEAIDRVMAMGSPEDRQISAVTLKLLHAGTDPGTAALLWAEKFHAEIPNESLNYRSPDGQPPRDLGRLNPLRNLYAITAAKGIREPRTTDAYVLETLAAKEHPSRYGVTLGIEVEIERAAAALVAPGADAYAEVEGRLDTLNFLTGAGLPRVEEAALSVFTEFALDPVHHYATTARELGQMIAMDAVPSEYTEHPLHVTLGYITIDGPRGPSAYVLARAIEATGWSCSGDRLRQPLERASTWAYRGIAGLGARLKEDIKGEAPVATEFRTFAVQSVSGAVRTLRSLQILGAALRAYQAGVMHTLDVTQRRLADAWKSFEDSVVPIFAEYGMTRPSGLWYAAEENDGEDSDSELDPDFQRLAELLTGAAAGVPQALEFQDRVQRHIIQARAEVVAILGDSDE